MVVQSGNLTWICPEQEEGSSLPQPRDSELSRSLDVLRVASLSPGVGDGELPSSQQSLGRGQDTQGTAGSSTPT